MKFHVTAYVNLKSALQKTTIKTYILTFWENIRKDPKRGVLALKVPEGHEPVFQGSAVYVHDNSIHILAKFHKDLMDG